MDKETILYTSTEEQIEKLKSQHLIIADEHAAKTSLLLYGYSNLIKAIESPMFFCKTIKKSINQMLPLNRSALYIF